ncbi:MAG: oleate hydratase [Ignavibacteriales bacterium]|nr:oleate hydratase [Ignavibacteriales bacterium]
MSSSFISKIVNKRLGDFKQQINTLDSTQSFALTYPKKVAVVGGGLAGVSAAIYLAERNFDVTIFERDSFLGGKVGSWPVNFQEGYKTNVEHGFHAFFRQYYNLRNLLKKIDAHKYLIPIDDYLIMTKDLGNYSFKEIKTTPVENILSMRKAGIYSFGDIIKNPKFSRLISLLNYNKETTYKKFDHVSFKEFADDVNLPQQMKLMFTTFSRAFFAEPQYISMAELIKSFHFYFLSNNHGLIYDVLNDDFEKTLWNPAEKYLNDHNAKIKLNTPVDSIEKNANKFLVNNVEFDYLILASDIKGTKKIVSNSKFIKSNHPEFYSQISKQKQSQRYAVLRIWIDKDVRKDVPFFIFTDALKILDSVTVYHRMEKTSEEWVKKNGGGIFELHSYAVPDDFPESEVRDQFLKEFEEYFPEIKDYQISHEYLQVKDDFTAFHTNLSESRPEFKTKIENLYLAGDWVKLDCPAMLMEAATTSALYCVNDILSAEGLKQEPIFSVPLKGIFA